MSLALLWNFPKFALLDRRRIGYTVYHKTYQTLQRFHSSNKRWSLTLYYVLHTGLQNGLLDSP